jgi:ribonuclease PH
MLIHERLQSVVLSNLSRSDGSALYAFGETVVQTSLFGPKECNQQKENVNKTTVEVIYRKQIRPINRGLINN